MTVEPLRIVRANANVSAEEGSVAVGHEATHYDLTLTLNRRMNQWELQAFGELWRARPHGDTYPHAYTDGERRALRLPGVPTPHLVMFYEIVRDLLANDLPDSAAKVREAERDMRQRVRAAVEQINADIAAQATPPDAAE